MKSATLIGIVNFRWGIGSCVPFQVCLRIQLTGKFHRRASSSESIISY